MIPVDRSTHGSGACGKSACAPGRGCRHDRATRRGPLPEASCLSRSPSCRSLVELAFGYPDRLVRAIGHPVIWIGQLISLLDRTSTATPTTTAQRRLAGLIALVLLVARPGIVRHRSCNGSLPLTSPSASLARRSWPAACLRSAASPTHVEAVADALEPAGSGGGPPGRLADRRPRPGAARRGGRLPRGHREPRREFLRRRRRAGLLAGDWRACRRRGLQGRQHRRFA